MGGSHRKESPSVRPFARDRPARPRAQGSDTGVRRTSGVTVHPVWGHGHGGTETREDQGSYLSSGHGSYVRGVVVQSHRPSRHLAGWPWGWGQWGWAWGQWGWARQWGLPIGDWEWESGTVQLNCKSVHAKK